jgi:hypothetical protein
MVTSSREPVASLRYRAIKGTVHASSRRPAVASTCLSLIFSSSAISLTCCSFISSFVQHLVGQVKKKGTGRILSLARTKMEMRREEEDKRREEKATTKTQRHREEEEKTRKEKVLISTTGDS